MLVRCCNQCYDVIKGVLGQYVTFEERPDLLKLAVRGLSGIACTSKGDQQQIGDHTKLLAEDKDNELFRETTRIELRLML